MVDLLFLNQFLKSPRSVGSIMPSSRHLAERMVGSVPWQEARAIAELGPGTGVFTRLILERKPADCDVLLFEADREMHRRLAEEFPDLSLHHDARDLPFVLAEHGIRELDCVISGLPFANFSKELRNQLIHGVVQSLKPGGLFIAFQYSLQMKKQLTETFADVTVSLVPWNLPPAFVYVCRKEEA